MNPDYDKQLEAAVNRELKALPELPAPDALARRLMTAIKQRARVPWYCRSWQTWPSGLQAAGLAVLLAFFGGLCFGGWQLSQAESATLALHRAGEWLARLNVIENTLNVLMSAAVLAVKKLGTGFMVTCLIVTGVGYALSIGLGTVYFRLAFNHRQESKL